MKEKTNKNIITEIEYYQEANETLDDNTVLDNGTMKMTTNDSVENETTEHQVNNLETGG